MKPEVHIWLPPEFISQPALNAALAELLGAWTKEWFTAAITDATIVDMTDLQKTIVKRDYAYEGEFLQAYVPQRSRGLLLNGALGYRIEQEFCNESDNLLLDALVERIISDLIERFENRMGQFAASANEQRLALKIGFSDEALCTLVAPAQAFAPLIKEIADRSDPSRTKPARRRDALASLPVDLEAVLGTAEVSVDDVHGLAVGDILLLDAPADGMADLRIINTTQKIISGKIGRLGSSATLTF
jgi:flagellar motor switch/type III secretory pathway protein FliN